MRYRLDHFSIDKTSQLDESCTGLTANLTTSLLDVNPSLDDESFEGFFFPHIVSHLLAVRYDTMTSKCHLCRRHPPASHRGAPPAQGNDLRREKTTPQPLSCNEFYTGRRKKGEFTKTRRTTMQEAHKTALDIFNKNDDRRHHGPYRSRAGAFRKECQEVFPIALPTVRHCNKE